MRTVNFRDDIIWPVASRLGYTPATDLLTDFADSLARYVNAWTRKVWDAADWPELSLLQTRIPINHTVPYDGSGNPHIPQPWDGTVTYNIDQVATDPNDSTSVYISLQNANLNNALSSGAFWALVPAWDNTKTYFSGDKVSDPTSGVVYVAQTTIQPNTILSDSLSNNPLLWLLLYSQKQPAPPPPGQTDIGKVLKVYGADPRLYDGPFDIPFKLYETYFHVGFHHAVTVFVKFMTRPSRYTLTPWSAQTTFGLNDVTYDPAGGNCYRSLQGNNTNHVVGATSWWVLVPFPYVIAEPVWRGVYSDALRDEGQHAKAQAEEQAAMAELQAAIGRNLAPRYDILTGQQTGVPRFQGAPVAGGGAA